MYLWRWNQSFSVLFTLCLRSSIKNITQVPSGKRVVINGFERLAHGLRRCCELTALFSSDTQNFCQASVLQYAMKPSQKDNARVGIIHFSVLGREFVHFLILMKRLNVIFFPLKCLFPNYCLAFYIQKKTSNEPLSSYLPVCFETEGRRMYKAEAAGYLLFVFCQSACVLGCWWWVWRIRQNPS